MEEKNNMGLTQTQVNQLVFQHSLMNLIKEHNIKNFNIRFTDAAVNDFIYQVSLTVKIYNPKDISVTDTNTDKEK